MVIFMDEDVPGGASAFMLQHVIEEQRGYEHLDAPPRTLTALASRSPYASMPTITASPVLKTSRSSR